MKRVVLILVACICFMAATAQKSSPQMSLGNNAHNFGTVKEGGGEVSHAFTFTNEGDKPLVIRTVDASCYCTKVKYPKRPIAPGGSGEIVVIFDPKNQQHMFYKVVQIYTNDPQKRHLVTIEGEVEK